MQSPERPVNDCEIEGRVEEILHVMHPHDLSLMLGGEGHGMTTCGSSLEVPDTSPWVFPSKFETWRLKGGKLCVSTEQLRPPPPKPCSWLRICLHLVSVAWLPTLHCYRSAFVTSSFCILFLQLEPQHQPWAYSGGLLQEPCEQGGDADAGGPGNVLIWEL